jgi:DNA-binding transcriptional MerR regulator
MARQSRHSREKKPVEYTRTTPKYSIGVVSQWLGLHPQALRRYEAAGLLEPARQSGKNRLYSDQDIELLQEIIALETEGVNAVGIRYILEMRRQVIILQQEVREAHRMQERSKDDV